MGTLRTNWPPNTKHPIFSFQNTPQYDLIDENTERETIHYFESSAESKLSSNESVNFEYVRFHFMIVLG